MSNLTFNSHLFLLQRISAAASTLLSEFWSFLRHILPFMYILWRRSCDLRVLRTHTTLFPGTHAILTSSGARLSESLIASCRWKTDHNTSAVSQKKLIRLSAASISWRQPPGVIHPIEYASYQSFLQHICHKFSHRYKYLFVFPISTGNHFKFQWHIFMTFDVITSP